MKRERLIYACLLIVICTLVFADQKIFSLNKNDQRVYDLSELRLTSIHVNCDIYVVRGQNKKMVIEGSTQDLNVLDINNLNGVLTVTNQNQSILSKILFGVEEKLAIKIYINHNDLDKIWIAEKANVISRDFDSYDAKITNYKKGNIFDTVIKFVTDKT